ncbi:MAG: GNAT family N-acetyltransferase [Paramuribaculum sp.]|nr:GNAT family N-acetyltransferase [Paramuribaculum sp.]
MITIRKAQTNDIKAIGEIYEKARNFMRSNGNNSQWSDGYPDDNDVATDIKNENAFVGEDAAGNIVMVFAFIEGLDPTYDLIEDGRWLNDRPYGTIHRLASDGKTGGVLQACLNFCFEKIDNLRIDTHRDNRPMLAALKKAGFARCGIIYCRDGSPRIAFQKDLTAPVQS